MRLLVMITGFLILSLPVFANEETPSEEAPSLEMLLFLAEFVDEQGNWDGPSMEGAAREAEMNQGEPYD